MNTISATEAQNKIISLMEEIAEEHKPVRIAGENSNAVLLSEEDWNAIQETLYLLSIPNMRESIIEGMKTPVEDCETELVW
jgi:prevent-host-death family protein